MSGRDDDFETLTEVFGMLGHWAIEWLDEPHEGWHATLSDQTECLCSDAGGCYCCDSTLITSEMALLLIRLGLSDPQIDPCSECAFGDIVSPDGRQPHVCYPANTDPETSSS